MSVENPLDNQDNLPSPAQEDQPTLPPTLNLEPVSVDVEDTEKIGDSFTDAEIKKSVNNYIRDCRTQGFNPLFLRYEPGRTFVIGHATDFDSLQKTILVGELQSPNCAEQSGTPIDTFTGHSPDEVSACVGSLAVKYTKKGYSNVDEQAGFLFETNKVPEFSLGYHGSGIGEKNFDSLSRTFRESLYDCKGGIEVGFNDRLSIEHALMVVRDTRVAQLKEKVTNSMKQSGNSESEIAEVLNRIWGFDSRFKNIDEATGWLTSTPEGNAVLKQKMGLDITSLPSLSDERRRVAVSTARSERAKWEKALASRHATDPAGIKSIIDRYNSFIEFLNNEKK